MEDNNTNITPNLEENPSERRSYTGTNKDPYKNENKDQMEVFFNVFFKSLPQVAIATKEMYSKFYEGIAKASTELGVPNEEIVRKMRDSLSDESKLIFAKAIESLDNLNEYGFGDVVKSENPVNDVSYGGYDHVLSSMQVKPTTDKPSPEFAFSKFQAILGLGVATAVVLYHSGFTVVLNPPTQSEFLKLQVEIFGTDQELGYSTSGYFNTAKRSKVFEILKEYIQSKIVAYTLDVSKESLFDYISLNDFDSLLLGILKGGFDSIKVSRTCYNVLDENPEAQRCTSMVEANLNPAKLLNISRVMLNDEMLMTLSKRKNGGVSLAEQNNYILALDKRIDEKRSRKSIFRYENAPGIGYEIKFKIPSVNEYIKASNEWIMKVEERIDELLETETEISRENAKSTIDIMTKLSGISSGIEYIKVYNETTGAEEVYDDNLSIMYVLEGNSLSYNDLLGELQESYVDFVNKSPITFVATPAYICPKCKSKVIDSSPVLASENLIGFNLIDFFFSVVEYQKKFITDRQMLG